jgi:hypothetical protein
MLTILEQLAADPNVSPALKRWIDPGPTWYRPHAGRWGRAFLSQADADAYDRGWANYPDAPVFESASGPEWTGYNDRDADQVEREEMRAEAARDARERE